MLASKTERRLQSVYEDEGGVGVIPWAEIIAIVVQLISSCTNKNAKAWAKEHRIAAKAAIRNQLRGDVTRKQLEPVVESVYYTFIAATNAEVNAARE